MVGTVMAMPAIASALGAFEIAYTCHVIATRNAPSPISEIVIPVHSTRKSRRRNGISRFAREKPPSRSSAS